MRLTALIALLSPVMAFAAIPSKTATPTPAKLLNSQGYSAGGLAGTGFSLRNVTFSQPPGKERLVIDIADINGADVRGYPGYYHVEMQENPHRLIIDFAQTPNVLIDEKTLQARLKSSKAISSSNFLIDPTDQTLTLILNLKKSAKAQVFQVSGQKGTSRVVVDLL